jgi:hypothetical protein
MNDIIKVGAKVRRRAWHSDEYVTVTAVGRSSFLGVSSWADDYERWFDINPDWVPFVEPVAFPERWCNVFPTSVSLGFPSRASAERYSNDKRIAVAHFRPDGTVEIERL